MASKMQLLPAEMHEALEETNGTKSNALEAQVEDAASDISGDETNSGGHGPSSPMEQMDAGEESPIQVPNENFVETEVAREHELNEGENERAEEREPHTTKLSKDYYVVEAIRAKRVHEGRKQYLIKWFGWPEETNTWEPLRHLALVTDMIDDFEKSSKSRKHSKPKRKQTVHSTTSKATKRRNWSLIREPHVRNDADSQRITNNPAVETVEVHLSEAIDSQRINNIPAVEPIEAHLSDAIDSQSITNIPAVEPIEVHLSDAIDSERITNIPVEKTDAIAAGDASNNDQSNHVEEVIESHHIVRIIKPDGYRAPLSDTDDPTLRFLVLRADGAQVLVDNHFLKENNPQLLFDYYEENINWQSRLCRHKKDN